MDKPTVYLETSVISYATSRPSRDLLLAARQQITRDWFAVGAHMCELYVSRLVVSELSVGDKSAARARVDFVRGFKRLQITNAARDLAKDLVSTGAVPDKAAEDALHIAVAAVHGLEYLLTWNCRHIANATMRKAIERACRAASCEPPTICTPEELAHDDPG